MISLRAFDRVFKFLFVDNMLGLAIVIIAIVPFTSLETEFVKLSIIGNDQIISYHISYIGGYITKVGISDVMQKGHG